MNTVKALFNIIKVELGDFNFKEAVVNNNLRTLDNARFVVDKKIDIPEYVQYMKKAVIHCPVDVYVYNSNDVLIATLKDGELSDFTNEYGRFAVVYNAYTEEYEKVICQSTDENLTIKTVAIDNGDVKYECAYKKDMTKIGIQTFDEKQVSGNDVITTITDMGTSSYNLSKDDIGMTNQMTKSIQVIEYTPLDILGDVNDDKAINVSDAVSMKKWLIKDNNSISDINSDINNDGKVNVFDYIALKRMLLEI